MEPHPSSHTQEKKRERRRWMWRRICYELSEKGYGLHIHIKGKNKKREKEMDAYTREERRRASVTSTFVIGS